MLFTSWQFILVFLPVTLAVFFFIPARWPTARKVWLCVASLFFYAFWKAEYLLLLLISVAFNFALAELLVRWRGRPAAKRALFVGVAVNLLLLGYFKYTNFLVSSLGWVTRQSFGRFDIILPLAISFFTFTQIGYLVDVSRDPKLRYGWLDFGLFVVFFPHLIAGPIVRHWEIIPQYAGRDLRLNRADLGTGLTLFLLGLFKKVLIADSVAVYANAIYGTAQSGVSLTWFDAWLGTLAYALQIYFDFSGYSDMAIGLARLFSIKFPTNFDSPYQAGNLAEFWRRWHMSLTRFLREYVYFPLGGNRSGRRRQAYNLLATFFLSGLWHGAGWTFVIWGVLHGLGLVVTQQWHLWKERFGWQWNHWTARSAAVLLTFVVVLFSWVYFRAPDLASAHRVLSSMVARQGLTFPAKAVEPGKPVGRLLTALGGKIVPGTTGVQDYSEAMRLVVALLALVWFCPNSQQLLRLYNPVIEQELRPSCWRLRLNGATGLVLGALVFLVIRQNYTALPSPFLYFIF